MSVTCKLQQVTSLSETYHIPQGQVREFSSALIHLPGHSPVPHSTSRYTFGLYSVDALRQCTATSLCAGWKSFNWIQTQRENWDVAGSRMLDQIWFPALYKTKCGQAYRSSRSWKVQAEESEVPDYHCQGVQGQPGLPEPFVQKNKNR